MNASHEIPLQKPSPPEEKRNSPTDCYDIPSHVEGSPGGKFQKDVEDCEHLVGLDCEHVVERAKLMWIAIDPGCSGGIAWTSSLELRGCTGMPETDGDLLSLLGVLRGQAVETTCFVEDIPKFTGAKLPGSSVAVMFRNFGFICGALAALRIRTILVRPQEWQKGYSLGTARSCESKTEWKNKLKGEAQRRYPWADVTLKTADALLILEHGMSTMHRR